MGAGRWNTNSYEAARAYRAARGIDDFAYYHQTRRLDPEQWKVAPELDPFAVVREARDSDEHPRSTPIAVLFDVTGSMRQVPRLMQERLPNLLGLLVDGSYVPDPQILFGAIGDADCDRVPLQIGQFESDNRMDDQLRQVFLEGGGGGQQTESYELAAWFFAHRVSADAIERHGRKGYLFVIGDEMNKPVVKARHLREVLGAEELSDQAVADVYRDLKRNWNTYFVLPKLTSYWGDVGVEDHWRALLGQRFLKLSDPTAISELIAVTIGVEEGTVDIGDALAQVQATTGTAAVVRRALGLDQTRWPVRRQIR